MTNKLVFLTSKINVNIHSIGTEKNIFEKNKIYIFRFNKNVVLYRNYNHIAYDYFNV